MPWFRKKKGKIEPVREHERVVRTENVFVRCEECEEHLYKKELEEALQVCTHCGYHFRIGAYDRLEKIFDEGYCEELDAEVISTDPLEFRLDADARAYFPFGRRNTCPLCSATCRDAEDFTRYRLG